MQIEWDEKKRQQTLAARQLDFADSDLILNSEPRFERLDARHDYGEERWVAVGFLRARLVVVLYTKRAQAYRIISMRKANAREIRLFEQVQAESGRDGKKRDTKGKGEEG